jgi:hypothetical protein
VPSSLECVMLTKSPSDLTFSSRTLSPLRLCATRMIDRHQPSRTETNAQRVVSGIAWRRRSLMTAGRQAGRSTRHNFNVAATFEHTPRGSRKQNRAVVAQHLGPLPGPGNPNPRKRVVNGLPLPGATVPRPDSARTLQAAEQDGTGRLLICKRPKSRPIPFEFNCACIGLSPKIP